MCVIEREQESERKKQKRGGRETEWEGREDRERRGRGAGESVMLSRECTQGFRTAIVGCCDGSEQRPWLIINKAG